jgi:flagellar hook-associated protein 1 FlgK
VADRVNTILSSGQVSAGPPAVAGQPLFAYSATTPTEVASSLTLDPSASAGNLAAIAPGPPVVANGVATQLAGLSTSQNSADQVGGLNYTGFYSAIASGIGQSQATADANQTTQSQLLAQVQNMRAQVSGVSLNDQAALIMQYQKSYQAAAQVVSTVNTVMQSLISMMQQIG